MSWTSQLATSAVEGPSPDGNIEEMTGSGCDMPTDYKNHTTALRDYQLTDIWGCFVSHMSCCCFMVTGTAAFWPGLCSDTSADSRSKMLLRSSVPIFHS